MSFIILLFQFILNTSVTLNFTVSDVHNLSSVKFFQSEIKSYKLHVIIFFTVTNFSIKKTRNDKTMVENVFRFSLNYT
jgi:hypothetical protein